MKKKYIPIKYYDGTPPVRHRKTKYFDVYAGMSSMKPGQWRAFEIPHTEHMLSAYNALKSYMKRHAIKATIQTDETRKDEGICIFWIKINESPQ